MAYYLGRAVQLVALVQLGYALYVGFIVGDWKTELKLLAIGACLFIIGRLIERRYAQT